MDIITAVQLAKKGNQDGFSFLYNETFQKNYYVAYRIMNNEEDAYDVLQKAYIKAFEKLDSLEKEEQFSSWIKVIVTRTAINEKKRRKEVLFMDLSPKEEEEGSDFEDFVRDERVDIQPELSFDQKETQRLIQQIICELSEEQRICINLFYMEEMSVKEIAEELQVSENTIKSRLNYGRKKIEVQVKELEKNGTKLYGFAPIPFLLFLYRSSTQAIPCSKYVMGELFERIFSKGIMSQAKAFGGTIGVIRKGMLAGKVAKAFILIPGIAGAVAVGTIGVQSYLRSQIEISAPEKNISLCEGDVLTLEYSTNDTKEKYTDTVSFESADETIVSVDENGQLHPKASGQTSVTMNYAQAQYTWDVTVYEKISIHSDQTFEIIWEGESINLDYFFQGGDGEHYPDISWTCSDEEHVDMEIRDDHVKVTGLVDGLSTITALLPNGEEYVWEIDVIGTCSISSEYSEIVVTCSEDGAIPLQYVCMGGMTDEVTFVSHDEDIATVSPDGVVTAVAEGTTTVEAFFCHTSYVWDVICEEKKPPVITEVVYGSMETVRFPSDHEVTIEGKTYEILEDCVCGYGIVALVGFDFLGYTELAEIIDKQVTWENDECQNWGFGYVFYLSYNKVAEIYLVYS